MPFDLAIVTFIHELHVWVFWSIVRALTAMQILVREGILVLHGDELGADLTQARRCTHILRHADYLRIT